MGGNGGVSGGCEVEGGLNRVPLPELPPPPARGRTRTLRWNYLPSLPSLDCPLCVLDRYVALISLGFSELVSRLVVGAPIAFRSAFGCTTLSLTSTSCRTSPSIATSCAA